MAWHPQQGEGTLGGMDVVVRRVYEDATDEDGIRVLVDRLWPRGLAKERARLDAWLRDVAPSAELRNEWHHDPDGHEPSHFAAFAKRYRAELAGSAALRELRALAASAPRVTLLTATRDPVMNHALVLREALLHGG